MNRVEEWYYEWCRSEGRPYFGQVMKALQGYPPRHAYMNALVQQVCRERDSSQPLFILEIGSWAGGSAITWAEALKQHFGGNGKVFCVDPWTPYFNPADHGGRPDYVIMNEALTLGTIFDLFQHNIKASANDRLVIPIRGAFSEVAPALGDERFDIVFIDGSHTYQGVLEDLNNAFHCVKSGGVVCGDDLELQVPQLDRRHAQANQSKDFVCDPRTQCGYHPGVSLAVYFYFGEVSEREGFWAMCKQDDGWIQVPMPEPSAIDLRIPAHLHSRQPDDYTPLLESAIASNDPKRAVDILTAMHSLGQPSSRAYMLVAAGFMQEAPPVSRKLIEKALLLDRYSPTTAAMLADLVLSTGSAYHALALVPPADPSRKSELLRHWGTTMEAAGNLDQAGELFARAASASS